MKTLIIIISIGIASFIGSAMFGVVGWFIGAIGAYVGCLFYFEKKESKRSTDGFLLRYRGEILSFVCSFICIVIGTIFLGGFIGLIVGLIGGYFFGNWLGGQIGWTGEVHEANVNVRLAYVTVLVAAAKSNGHISDKEEKEILRATRALFSSLGYGQDADVQELFRGLSGENIPIENVIAIIRDLPPQIHQALQFDILKILFSSGNLASQDEAWLNQIVGSGSFSDWSMLQFFMRLNGNSDKSREAALQELGLDTSASLEDIKKAYKKKASEYHPDKLHNVPPQIKALAEAKMASINSAYHELTGKRASAGQFYFRDETGDRSFALSQPADFVCTCWLCGTKNRIPQKASLPSARCGECHALLGTEFDPLRGGN